ncbi:MAG: radical SAM protein [Chloroflexota bacterium]|nr:radical SAM protein [Chloroflexota bacterium]
MIRWLSRPALVTLELTPDCTNRCPGCFNPFRDARNRPPLPASEWRRILEKICPDAHLVKLSGGEPTLHPEFDDILTFLDEFDQPFSLFTNALWERPGWLVQRLCSLPQFHVALISLHGVTPTAHEVFTGTPGSFTETVTNLRHAVRAGLTVCLSTVIHRHNLNELEGVAQLAAALGVRVSFARMLCDEPSPLEPTPDELRAAVAEIERLREAGYRVKFGNCIPQCFTPSASAGCLAGVAYCAVGPWGDLRPCTHSLTLCGNLLTDSLAEVWQSPAMQSWRSLIPPACHRCAAFSQCHGGCHALSELRGTPGDPLMRGPQTSSTPPPPIRLSPDWCPAPTHFELRAEPFGPVLLRGNRVVPIQPKMLQVLDACDGRTTLSELEGRFGPWGIEVVAALAQQKMLHFVRLL